MYINTLRAKYWTNSSQFRVRILLKLFFLQSSAVKVEDEINDVDDEDEGDEHPLHEGHPPKSESLNEKAGKGWPDEAAKEEQGRPKS